MKAVSSKAIALDASAVGLISFLICIASDQLMLMTIAVPGIIVLRTLLIPVVLKDENPDLIKEVLFLVICTVLGGFNDWNSVDGKSIYQYNVPHYFEFSTIPIWMLIYWGMILRFIASLSWWEKLDPDKHVSNNLALGTVSYENKWGKIIGQLVLVLITRQFIYVYYNDPLLSWVPFNVALLLFALIFGFSKNDLKLMVLFLFGGPLIEILYIEIGGLHSYHLDWLGGVPLWLVLWWLLIVIIWKDLSARIQMAIAQLA